MENTIPEVFLITSCLEIVGVCKQA